MRGNRLSLKKSAFLRLFIITFVAVTVFYVMGLSINAIGIRYVRDDLQTALDTHASFISEELERDFDNLDFFMMELLSDPQLLRYAIAYDTMDDYERLTYIKALSKQEYMIKRSSSLAESVQIMLPGLKRTIITDLSLYTEMDERAWDALLKQSERNNVTVTEWENRIWLLLPHFDRDEPLFLIAIEITADTLLNRLGQIGAEFTEGMQLIRADGSAFVGSAPVDDNDRNALVSEAFVPSAGLLLRCYSHVDEQMKPFVHYRAILWILSLVALGLLFLYLMYYRVAILRPLNDIFDTMRESGKDGRYRIERRDGSDFDDIYAQFNDMVEHIEALAGQVYEERYRAQQAELKQLQMQIDPHFLYNSLYLIYRIAEADGSDSIASLSMNLSNYYCYITKMPEQIVFLKDEISHVMNYMEIQRMRFEPRIHIEVDALPPAIAEERIPSLVIQPIVENAFQHGLKDRASGGLVTMRYRCMPDAFQVIVADNSGKMDEEKVAALWESLRREEEAEPNALRNLYRRLMIYGNGAHGLELKCVDGGLTVILTFPRRGVAV